MVNISQLRRSARRGGSDAAEQIAELRESIETLSDDLSRLVRRSARSAGGSAWDGLDVAQDALEEGYSYARDAAYDAARRGRRMARRHPVPAAALAAGIGLVLVGLVMNLSSGKDD